MAEDDADPLLLLLAQVGLPTGDFFHEPFVGTTFLQDPTDVFVESMRVPETMTLEEAIARL